MELTPTVSKCVSPINANVPALNVVGPLNQDICFSYTYSVPSIQHHSAFAIMSPIPSTTPAYIGKIIGKLQCLGLI